MSNISSNVPPENAVIKDPIDLIKKYKETFFDPASGSKSFCFWDVSTTRASIFFWK